MRLAVLAVLFSTSARAEGLDLDTWLRRPGVKLVAVEFYATWCKPCMEAVPKWRDLHGRHRADGLRLIVVATQDPKGGCVNPGWNPDDVVCDDDGHLAERLGAGSLPAAFLWSWQGDLLVARGHVDEVERAVAAWKATTPRVLVEVSANPGTSKIKSDELRDLVRARLGEDDKLMIVATETEAEKLRALKKKSFAESYDSALQCELGKEISANSLLDVTISLSSGRHRLRLNMLSAERGCLVASALVDFTPGKARVSIAEAVAHLMDNLRRPAQLPEPSQKRDPTFGVSLGPLTPVPTVAPLEAAVGKTSLSATDVELLKLLQNAKRADANKDLSAKDKAAIWSALAAYRDPNPLREQAEKREAEWSAIFEAEQKRRDQLREVHRQYVSDKAKLADLLAFDDDVVTADQKKAFQKEFDGAYASWKSELEAQDKRLKSRTVRVGQRVKYPGYRASGVAFDPNGNLWVGDWSQGVGTKKIYSLRVDGSVLEEIPSPNDWPGGMAFIGKDLWIATMNKVGLYERPAHKFAKELATGHTQFYGRALTFDGRRFWYGDHKDSAGVIQVIDLETGAIEKSLSLPQPVDGLAWARPNLWMSHGKEIALIDSANGATLWRWSLDLPNKDGALESLAFDGASLWVTMVGGKAEGYDSEIVKLEMTPAANE